MKQEISDRQALPATTPVRPVGAWVVAGFLTVVTLGMWLLVCALFYVRS